MNGFRWDAILKRLPEGPVIGAEIGVLRGKNAFNLLNARKDLTLYMIDVWKEWAPDSRYVGSGDFIAVYNQKQWDEIYQKVINKAKEFGNRAIIIRELSTNAAKLIKDASLDFVFIDAEHGYDACLEDLNAWAPKVKIGGWISGHDWGDHWKISQAVSTWAENNGLKEIQLDVDATWFIKVKHKHEGPLVISRAGKVVAVRKGNAKSKGAPTQNIASARTQIAINNQEDTKRHQYRPISDLKDFFERVYVINLRHRVDRLYLFQQRLKQYGWPFKEPIVYPAIDGDKVGVPPEFTRTSGTYGCRMSHLRILQDCLMDNVKSVLILEDDAEILEDFPARAAEFLEKLPNDWEGIMFGGQHIAPPIIIDIPNIVRVRACLRNHAYAARPSYMQALQRYWGNSTGHSDATAAKYQHLHIVYAPHPWLIGQAGGRSNVRGGIRPPEWWSHTEHKQHLPLIIIKAPIHVIRRLFRRGLYAGRRRDPNTEVDVRLENIYHIQDPMQRKTELQKWLSMLESECVAGLLPAIVHPKADIEELAEIWESNIYLIEANNEEAAWAQLPQEIKESLEYNGHLRFTPIILLRCPSDMIESLPLYGFYPGCRFDPIEKFEYDLVKICKQIPENTRIDELRKWCKRFCREADNKGMFATIIHPELNLDILQTVTNRKIIEISATSIEELLNSILCYT